jgi:hypothetical protein
VRLFFIYKGVPLFFLEQLDEQSSRCDILMASRERFLRRLFPALLPAKNASGWTEEALTKEAPHLYAGVLTGATIVMHNERGCADKYPEMDMDEQCKKIRHTFIILHKIFLE